MSSLVWELKTEFIYKVFELDVNFRFTFGKTNVVENTVNCKRYCQYFSFDTFGIFKSFKTQLRISNTTINTKVLKAEFHEYLESLSSSLPERFAYWQKLCTKYVHSCTHQAPLSKSKTH